MQAYEERGEGPRTSGESETEGDGSAGTLVLPRWNIGTVVTGKIWRLSSAKREGVSPGAIRTNGESVRHLTCDAYHT